MKTSEPLTLLDLMETGSDGSTSSAEGFLVSRSVQRPEEGGLPPTFGPRWNGSSENSSLNTSLPRTSKNSRYGESVSPSVDGGTDRLTAVLARMIAGQTIREIVGGPVHTPLTKANFLSPSMQKWPACRRYVAAFGPQQIMPEQFEFLMGFPIGWSELEPSETPSSP